MDVGCPDEGAVSEPAMPCCDYRDHGSNGCACPEHPQSELHPFGFCPTHGEEHCPGFGCE